MVSIWHYGQTLFFDACFFNEFTEDFKFLKCGRKNMIEHSSLFMGVGN